MAFIKQKFNKTLDECLKDYYAPNTHHYDRKLGSRCLLTEDDVKNHLDKIDWWRALSYQVFTEDFLRTYLYKFDFDNASLKRMLLMQKLSISFIEEIFTKYPSTQCNCGYWDCVSYKQKLDEGFIRKYKDKLSWKAICMKQKLSETFMLEHESYLDFKMISRHQNLSSFFIEDNLDKLSFDELLKNKKLSPEAKDVLLKNSHKIVSSLLSKKVKKTKSP